MSAAVQSAQDVLTVANAARYLLLPGVLLGLALLAALCAVDLFADDEPFDTRDGLATVRAIDDARRGGAA